MHLINTLEHSGTLTNLKRVHHRVNEPHPKTTRRVQNPPRSAYENHSIALSSSVLAIDDLSGLGEETTHASQSGSDKHTSALSPPVRLRRNPPKFTRVRDDVEPPTRRTASHATAHPSSYFSEKQADGDISLQICRKRGQIETPLHCLRAEIQRNQRGKLFIYLQPVRFVLRRGQNFRQRPSMSTTTANISPGIGRHRGDKRGKRKWGERPSTPVKTTGAGEIRRT
ncbi:hypothetical protein Bca4012_020509 [Brassica carinata]